MRRNIDKYLITIQEKVELGLSRLRELTLQAGRFCHTLGEDKNLGIAAEEVEGEVKLTLGMLLQPMAWVML